MCSALQLPALEVVRIDEFSHRGGLLQLSQLSGSCLHVSRLEMECSLARPGKASEQPSGLLNLSRLADLHIIDRSPHADMDLDLPASLTRLQLQGNLSGGQLSMDFFWVLLQAVNCIRRGAELHTLDIRMTEASFQPARWGATLEEQFKHVGRQLNGLKVVEVWGRGDLLDGAISAIASSAPSLTRLKFSTSCNEPPPICSASLESIVVNDHDSGRMASPVILTLLPGCIRLQKVLVQLQAMPREGSMVKICCYCSSPSCIVPFFLNVLASQAGQAYAMAPQTK